MLGFAFVLLMWPQPPSHPPCWSTALCLELCRTRNHSSGLAPRFSIAVEQSVTPDALCRSAPLPHRMPHPPSASPHAASSLCLTARCILPLPHLTPHPPLSPPQARSPRARSACSPPPTPPSRCAPPRRCSASTRRRHWRCVSDPLHQGKGNEKKICSLCVSDALPKVQINEQHMCINNR